MTTFDVNEDNYKQVIDEWFNEASPEERVEALAIWTEGTKEEMLPVIDKDGSVIEGQFVPYQNPVILKMRDYLSLKLQG